MKKSLLLLPLVALTLTACNSSGGTTESSSAEITDATSTTWQTEVQSAPMPSSMTTPVYNQPTYNVPQPMPQATYGQSYGNTETVGNCQVVRDANNAPIYSQIQKGCYSGDTYTVGKYDTLFLVAYLSGQNVQQLAQLNNLNTTEVLKIGQVLRVR